MGILRNTISGERSTSNISKDENQRDDIVMRLQPEFDAMREDFRKYLERAGVIDAFTKVLVLLYEETEKPDDALEYVCKYLRGIKEDTSEVHTLKKELEDAKARISELEEKLMKCELEDASA